MDCYETLDNPQVEDPHMRMQYNNGVVKMKSPRSQRRGKVDTLWFDQIPIDRQTRRRAGKSGPSLRNMSCSAATYQWELTVRSFDKNVLVRANIVVPLGGSARFRSPLTQIFGKLFHNMREFHSYPKLTCFLTFTAILVRSIIEISILRCRSIGSGSLLITFKPLLLLRIHGNLSSRDEWSVG